MVYNPRKKTLALIQKRQNSMKCLEGGGKSESDEISAIYGDWKITEYLGQSVEYHGTEATTNNEKNENEKIVKRIKEKYLNKKLHIDSKNITAFSPPTELGYYVSTWNDLFSIYRQPSDIWEDISPPFICISFSLKDFDDSLGFIVDTNGIATLVVKGQFFRLD
jgi:phosphopantothenoylcysteine synthetase/decarboxylase